MSQPNPTGVSAEEAVAAQEKAELARYRNLPPLGQAWLLIAAVGSVLASVYIIFGIGNLVTANTPFTFYVPLETEYFYFMLALLLPLAFLIYPLTSGAQNHIPIYDWALALVAAGICTYFAISGNAILDVGWEYDAPDHAKYLAYVLWALVLEATRRAGGNAIFAICLIVSVYPMLSQYAPGFLKGNGVSPSVTAGFHIFGTESMLGIPMNAFANLVVGFLVFGVALQYTGGGTFFLNLAFSLLGKKRGGPAKVAIFASGLMGSMSGSVITNVLTTGVMSIPAMKRVGFRGAYAGGVEACASTGGVLMPPVMGATAFVMATYLELPYSAIVVAAAFPSLLYYLGLYLQIDAYAARNGLKGLPAEELPAIGQVLREGWYYVFVFVLLIVMLLYLQREAQAPYYATVLLIVINQFSKAHRWSFSRFVEFIKGVGLLFAELAALLAGVGLIIGALTLTGKIGSLTYELVNLAGNSAILLLIMAALTSFVLGIGMTVTAAYLFLAVTVAPALTDPNGAAMDKLAVHLFLLYWGMISFITPPVAIGAYAAASIAKSDPMKTGFEAMRLGSIIYFVPFFFVLNPALIGNGTASEIAIVFSTTVAGIWIISSGLQGYMFGLGALDANGLGWVSRVLLVVGGVILALPGNNKIVGYSHLEINIAALAIIAVGVLVGLLCRRDVDSVPAKA
ncbi:MAG: TRAP transporter fused permease subunit [Hyphomicrobiaceae bacterium]|nr:TRAP transporter fused permease subunit [Hyphomicrobiaceae bacterium]